VEVTVADLVAARALETPEATAIVAGDDRLTYHELDTRANRFAHDLRALGVGRDVLVGLCFEPCVAMVVGALGILKAGGAYVPLAPSYPGERIAFMLHDTQTPVVVTEPQRAASLPNGDWQVVRVDSGAASLAPGCPRPPPGTSAADDLAYVIYTSGSTGRPKGVQIKHDGLMNLAGWHRRAFNVTSSDRATQLANPAFDATVWELWPYLTTGASIYIADQETRLDPVLLRTWLLTNDITISFVATPMAEILMTLEWPRRTSLRVLLTGADTLHRYPASTLPFAVVNNYGPTETTVVATSGVVPPQTAGGILPSIGKPITNISVYVLDENRVPVHHGEAGELYIGGRGVARGYLNRPDLTAERFIADPFSQIPGARMYRTGDLVRLRADGNLEFIGRSDQQVKIRGFRIELGEVETVLSEHPAVRQAAVIAREDPQGEKTLVAYVVAAPGCVPAAQDLRHWLKMRLPDYMIPASMVQMNALPLTINGKVDREALPRPDQPSAAAEAAEVPRTLIEEKLARIVHSLLQVERVSREENFFLLGGHSLLGAQLITRVNDTFRVELPLRTLFDKPTISGLSAEIEGIIVARLDAISEEEAERLLA
jgi:amino acid adenylation domain-containing protein